jgi:NAD(P)H-dependent flavin oxidoreductase YrpB (nitropropane dioxygenase family)
LATASTLAAGVPNTKIYLVGDKTLNAFTPGGSNVFINTGLIQETETPNELVGVIAHETGHVAGGHIARVGEMQKAGMVPMILTMGLGILAAATMTLDELATAISKVKAATDKPFGVNIRADAADAGDRVDLMIREGVKVASFALAPKPELINRLKEAGAVVIPSIGAAKHARKVAAWGADAMIVQGGEGGGHTGPVPTTLLLPSVLDAVAGTGIPVIAAGGFFDGRGLAAALSYGAAGVAMGTRFLLTSDSTVPDAVKQRYLEATPDGTVVTKRVDGMPHRVLRTGLVEKLESGSPVRGFVAAVGNAAKFKKMSQMTWRSIMIDGLAMRRGKDLTWSQVVMAANTPMLLKAGLVDGNTQAGVLASGQVTGLLDDLPSCAALIESIVRDAIKHLQSASELVEP